MVQAHHVRASDGRPTSFSNCQLHVLFQTGCAKDAAAFLECGHLVQRLLTQAEFASDEGGQSQVSRHGIFSGIFGSHGEIVEATNGAHQPIFSLFSLLNPWRESYVPPGRRASQQLLWSAPPAGAARAPGRRSCSILSLFLRALRLTALHSAGMQQDSGQRKTSTYNRLPPWGAAAMADGREPCRAWGAARQQPRREPRVYLYRKLRRGTSYFPCGSHFNGR